MVGSKLHKLIARRHPLYKGMKAHWEFLEATYNGGREWFGSNIFRYHKEGDGEYSDRVARAYRFNHTREVVDLINKYLFRGEIHRNYEDAPKQVVTFWKNVDGRGTDIKEFAKSVSQKSSIAGRTWVIVDNKMTEETQAVSVADEQEGGVYAYAVSPLDVLDMSWGDDGALNWILIREYYRDDSDPFESSGKVSQQYRLWTRNDWYLVRSKNVNAAGEIVTSHVELSSGGYELADEGHHGLSMVPAICVDNVIGDGKWTTPALINDIAYLDRAVANYLSNLDAIIQDQTFSQLAMPAQNIMPGEEAYEKMLELGTKRIFVYDGEGGAGPHFLSPDPRQAQLIISAIQQIINEIYHSVGLAGERTKADNAKGIDNSSGVAKSKDFERVNSLLISKADSLEVFENRLVHLVAAWSGAKLDSNDDDLVEYSDSFDVRGLYDEFDIAMQLALIEAPTTLRSEQMNQVVKKLFPVLSKELKERIKKDVEEWQSDLEERRKLNMEGLQTKSEMETGLLEEAKRNRDASGDKQSETKGRKTKAQKEGQESDRETT